MAKSKVYIINEQQLKAIRENVITEEPNQFDKGDKIQLLSPVEGYNIPPKSIGTVIHVDALGTVRAEFDILGEKVIVPINPEVDDIRNINDLPF